MRLIEISCGKCRVENGASAHEQGSRMTCPLDLLVAAEGHARDAAKMTLHRSLAHPVDIAFHRRIGRMASRNNPGKRQSAHEDLGILVVRNLPDQIAKPETTVGE